jgi:ribosomal protein S18 acetylase RimI-like enzyme
MTVTVRRATRADLPSVASLAGELVRMHHETDRKRFFLPERVEEGYAWWLGRELDRKEAVVMVAEVAERVVGYAYGSLEERNWNALLDAHGEIHDLYVAETERRKQVGRALLDALVRELEALGADPIVLATMVGNVAAQHLFEAAGFRRTMVELTRDAGGPR